MNNRNKPCPCNSGKKFKKCCGDAATLIVRRQEAEALRREADAKQQEIRRERNAANAARFGRLGGGSLVAAMVLGMAAIGGSEHILIMRNDRMPPP